MNSYQKAVREILFGNGKAYVTELEEFKKLNKGLKIAKYLKERKLGHVRTNCGEEENTGSNEE